MLSILLELSQSVIGGNTISILLDRHTETKILNNYSQLLPLGEQVFTIWYFHSRTQVFPAIPAVFS